MKTFILFPSHYDDSAYGNDLPVAVLIRVDAAVLSRMEAAVIDIERGNSSTSVLTLRDGDVRWIKKMGYRSDNSLAGIPGFFDPETDSVVALGDSLNMDIDDVGAEFAEECVVFGRAVLDQGVEITRFRDHLVMAPSGRIECGRVTYDFGTLYEDWNSLAPKLRSKLGVMACAPANEEAVTLNAMRMVEALARAGYVHPESDDQGRRQVLEWARSFENAGDGSRLVRHAAMKARLSDWVAVEDRDGIKAEFRPAEDLFRLELAAVQSIQALAPYVPVSLGQAAMIDKVTRELTRRAGTQLLTSKAIEAPFALEQDGRFVKLKAHGLTLASLDGEPSIDQWLEVLHANMEGRFRIDDRHEVRVTVDGEEFVTSGEVRVSVRNDFMIRDDEDGSERQHSVQHVFTNEGVITNVFDGEGDEVATDAEMYGDLVGRYLGDDEESHEVER